MLQIWTQMRFVAFMLFCSEPLTGKVSKILNDVVEVMLYLDLMISM